MLSLSSFLLVSSALFNIAYAAGDGLIAAHRREADEQTVNALAALRKRSTGELPTKLGKSLYWFGHFDVGKGHDYHLLLDTGSSDCILNNNLYKPSNYKKSYGTGNFSISYEGVNRAGFGFETINGTTQRDIVSAAGLTVKEQALGAATSFKYFDVKQLPSADQGNGIIGFLGTRSSSFKPPALSWIFNLCREGSLSSCRFGLAFGTSGKGSIALGKLAKNLIKGELVVLPRSQTVQKSAYTVFGDVTINNTIVAENQTIIMDVGTDNIQGPIGATKKILDMLGYQTHLAVEKTNLFGGQINKVLSGYFPCDQPPELGFSFPAKANLKAGEEAKIFNVAKSLWDVYNHGNNNCTSILGGTNALTDAKTGATAWLLGQPFFAGHYVDFVISHPNTVAFGDLVDPSMSSST